VRSPTTILVATASTAALAVAWHIGAHPAGQVLAGVEVVTPPAVPPAATGPVPSHSKTPVLGRRKTRHEVDGAVVRTPYGTVQVQVVLTGNRISDVRALHLTDANSTSRRISAGAAPLLRHEALTAQSAKVDTVSGATYTSQGYQMSLQAALDQAHR
jgi:uncharacterized protein with FMN-binding domain